VQFIPDVESHPVHPPNVPFGDAVKVIAVLEGNVAVHEASQLSPAGTLVMVPVPGPAKLTASVGPTKQTTLVVMVAVTIAPDDLPLLMVAEIKVLPQPMPVAVTKPEVFTVAMSGVLDVHVD
jgi:hypothetical protein